MEVKQFFYLQVALAIPVMVRIIVSIPQPHNKYVVDNDGADKIRHSKESQSDVVPF